MKQRLMEDARCRKCGEPIDTAQMPRDRNAKACPYCAETIAKDARKCRYCGEFLDNDSTRKKNVISVIKGVFSRKGAKGSEFQHIPTDKIEANPYQPREFLDKQGLADLKRSMKQYGIIVPLIVKREGAGYQLVAGQRRLQAAKEIGMKFVPAIVRTLSVREMMEVSYLENLHRSELNGIDVVQMFERICTEYPEIGRERLASMLGLDLKKLTRDKELLKMPVLLQEAVRRGMINEEHARLLRSLDSKATIAAIEEIYRNRLSIEETDELINRLTKKKPKYISSANSQHFHSPECPYSKLFEEGDRTLYYSKREAVMSGKRACLTCL